MADPQTKKPRGGEAHHFDVDENKTLFSYRSSAYTCSHITLLIFHEIQMKYKYIYFGWFHPHRICVHMVSRSRSGHKESTFLFYYCNFCCGNFGAYDKNNILKYGHANPFWLRQRWQCRFRRIWSKCKELEIIANSRINYCYCLRWTKSLPLFIMKCSIANDFFFALTELK